MQHVKKKIRFASYQKWPTVLGCWSENLLLYSWMETGDYSCCLQESSVTSSLNTDVLFKSSAENSQSSFPVLWHMICFNAWTFSLAVSIKKHFRCRRCFETLQKIHRHVLLRLADSWYPFQIPEGAPFELNQFSSCQCTMKVKAPFFTIFFISKI